MFAKVFVICAALAAAHASLIAPIGYGAPVASLAISKGLIATPAVATVSSQKSVINHVAPTSHVAVAPAPIAHASHGVLANGIGVGHGIPAASLTVGTSVYGAPAGLGVGHLGYGHGAAVSSQKSVINHIAPAAPLAVASHGIAAAPLTVGTSVYGAPVGLGVGPLGHGHGAVVSSQKSVINHVAPAHVAAAPVALASHGIHGNGIVTGNGILVNELVGGHGIAAPYAIGNGHLGTPVALGHGSTVSSQKSVISHVAPASRVAVAAAPVALAHNGILNNELIGGHGIVGNGLIAGAPLGIAGHGYSALPLSVSSSIHGAPVALGLGKHIY